MPERLGPFLGDSPGFRLDLLSVLLLVAPGSTWESVFSLSRLRLELRHLTSPAVPYLVLNLAGPWLAFSRLTAPHSCLQSLFGASWLCPHNVSQAAHLTNLKALLSLLGLVFISIHRFPINMYLDVSDQSS